MENTNNPNEQKPTCGNCQFWLYCSELTFTNANGVVWGQCYGLPPKTLITKTTIEQSVPITNAGRPGCSLYKEKVRG